MKTKYFISFLLFTFFTSTIYSVENISGVDASLIYLEGLKHVYKREYYKARVLIDKVVTQYDDTDSKTFRQAKYIMDGLKKLETSEFDEKMFRKHIRQLRKNKWQKKVISTDQLILDINSADKNGDKTSAILLREKLQKLYRNKKGLYHQNKNYTQFTNIFSLEIKLSKEIITIAKALNDKDKVLEHQKNIAKLNEKLASYFSGKGNYKDSEKHRLIAIKWYEIIGNPVDILSSKRYLAEMYEMEGSYDKAKTLYIELVDYSKKTLPERIKINDNITNKSLTELKKIKSDQRKLYSALNLGPEFQKKMDAIENEYQKKMKEAYKGMESGLESTITNSKSRELYFQERILDINKKISNKENFNKTKIDSIETNNYSDYGRISQTLNKLIYNNNLQSANQLAKKH